MAAQLTIGRLASKVGLPASTIRYYERRGLLQPAGRSRHRYRHYDESSVARLRLIRAAQHCGFSLTDIGILLRLLRSRSRDCRDFVELAERRLERIRQALDSLTRTQDALSEALRICRDDVRCRSSCVVLDRLERVVTGAGGA